MIKDIFVKKNVETLLSENLSSKTQLRRALSRWELVALGVGCIIGAGIFTVIGTATAGTDFRIGAGPGIIVSFLITGLACSFSALCYAEFSSLIPISGSAYTYSYTVLGEIIAWIIGWDLILEYNVAALSVSISWSAYIVSLLQSLGIKLPIWLSLDYQTFLHQISLNPSLAKEVPQFFGYMVSLNLPAIFIISLITIIMVIGIKESSFVNSIMVITKLIILLFFVLIGIFFIKPINFNLPDYGFFPNGWNGVMVGGALIFFAYIGFDAISTFAEETKNPQKDLPFGIIGSLLICTIIYIVVSIVLIGIVPFTELGRADPIAYALRYINIEWASGIVSIGAIMATTSVILVLLLGQSRIFFSIARDGLMPSAFSKVHHKFKTPYLSSIITGCVIAFFAGFINIGEAAELTNIGTLFAFIIVCISVIILRIKEPNRPRPFVTPLNPIIPALGVISCLYLTLSLPLITWIRFLIWFIFGIVIYIFYGYKHSKLRKTI